MPQWKLLEASYPSEVAAMNSLAWLAQRRFESVVHREHDWVFMFEGAAQLTVECLWRLLDRGRIRITSEDDGQQFGLPAPVAAADELNRRLASALVASVSLREGTLDLELRFNGGCVLQMLPTMGYEAWNVSGEGRQFVAVGGGQLAIYSDRTAGE